MNWSKKKKKKVLCNMAKQGAWALLPIGIRVSNDDFPLIPHMEILEYGNFSTLSSGPSTFFPSMPICRALFSPASLGKVPCHVRKVGLGLVLAHMTSTSRPVRTAIHLRAAIARPLPQGQLQCGLERRSSIPIAVWRACGVPN